MISNNIFITLREDISDNEILSVLVHEICEVVFLARGLSIALNEREDEIIELFSHQHFKRLAEILGLEEIDGLYKKDTIEIYICTNDVKFKKVIKELKLIEGDIFCINLKI